MFLDSLWLIFSCWELLADSWLRPRDLLICREQLSSTTWPFSCRQQLTVTTCETDESQLCGNLNVSASYPHTLGHVQGVSSLKGHVFMFLDWPRKAVWWRLKIVAIQPSIHIWRGQCFWAPSVQWWLEQPPAWPPWRCRWPPGGWGQPLTDHSLRIFHLLKIKIKMSPICHLLHYFVWYIHTVSVWYNK